MGACALGAAELPVDGGLLSRIQFLLVLAPTMKPYTFEQFNAEINEFHKYLKENNFTDEEICKIFTPLRPDSKKINLPTLIIISTILLIITLYFSTYIETISWHLSALGRIILIKLLPFWDWTALKNAKCLIEKPTSTLDPQEISFNCDLCENINQIDVYDEISGDFLKKRYLDIDTPIIIRKSHPEFKIDSIFHNYEIANSKPCNLQTNIHNGVPRVKNLLQKTELFDNFFIHFQNCELPAMKQFRGFTPRPQFLPPELSPVQYNWLLWSKNYNITQFKSIPLVEKVAVVGQIIGRNYFRLVPRRNCEWECPVLDVQLEKGESVILTSLWNLEYRPDEEGENIAVILEMH